MQQFARAALVAVLLGLSGSLQGCGCGCDEEAGEKCVMPYKTALGCDDFASITRCIDNAGCCDFEDDNGINMKSHIADLKVALTIADHCTDSQMTDNCA
jgi:hypothetical protein